MLKNKSLATAAVLFFCVSAVFLAKTLKPNPEVILKQRIAERSLGSEKAPLWVTEYFDYQCPPCAAARATLETALKERPGQIYLQARFYPLPAHKNAMKAALYAECASRQKGKFWKFHDELFDHQTDWAMDEYAAIKFASYAEDSGLDVAQLDTCTHDPETEKTILEEKKKGTDLGVTITPSFFVNGKIVVGKTALKNEIDVFFEGKKS